MVPLQPLDLDEVDLVERYHEQIDFVDAAVLGDEFEVRPRAERLAVRQAGLQVVEASRSQAYSEGVISIQRADFIAVQSGIRPGLTSGAVHARGSAAQSLKMQDDPASA